MAPKFRGGSDDWLDDEEKPSRVSHGRGSRKPAPKGEELPLSEGNATVTEVHPKLCRVRMDEGGEALCSFRRAGVIRQAETRERTFVAVGDRVKATRSSPDAGVVEAVCARRNRLSRPAPGREEGNRIHVIAANLDFAVIVVSAREPEFSSGLLDRFLIGAHAGGVTPVICITKMDLVASSQGAPQPWQVYRDAGYVVHETCSKTGLGVEELKKQLVGKTVLFCGQSGVGKTSILRKLTGHDIGKVGEISESTGRGKHTTTVARMIDGPEGSLWIDSPGVREFGLEGMVEAEKLAAFFPEFNGLACAVESCQHDDEPGCRAKDLPRHPAYQRILHSLRRGEG